ncbi:MAG: glycogen/starch synthase [bacterium]
MKLLKPNPIKILFVSAEVAPFAKVGGLSDVAGALPPALKKLGMDIIIMMPLYGSIKKIYSAKVIPSLAADGINCDETSIVAIECAGKNYPLKEIIKNFEVEFDGKIEKVSIYETFLNNAKSERSSISNDGNMPVYFIDNKKFFSGNDVYGGDDKFLFFSKAAADIIMRNEYQNLNRIKLCPDSCLKEKKTYSLLRWIPNIVHCNDNHTALMPTLLKEKNSSIKTILTIHNLEYQGKIVAGAIKKIKLSRKKNKTIKKDAQDGDINKMVQGILSADAITTVSPTYAKEILTKQYGEGLENILKMRKKNLYGIINGIDIKEFNPETDPHIKHNYSQKNLDGKKKCKEKLISDYFLNISSYLKSDDASSPLIGLVSRLVAQKGIDLVISAIPELFKNHPKTLFIILGTGSPEYEKKLKELGEKYPNNFKPLITFDIKIAQLIYAASDIFLMPSKFEPCGLGQLIAMRYGSVPIARKTGGLADTIISLKFKCSKICHKEIKGLKVNDMNGFLFEKYTSQAMLKAINDALYVYQNKKIWKKIMLNGMKRDSSWTEPAKKYVEIYKSILKP